MIRLYNNTWIINEILGTLETEFCVKTFFNIALLELLNSTPGIDLSHMAVPEVTVNLKLKNEI